MRKIVVCCFAFLLAVLLCGLEFIPVKYAVYADKDDERKVAWGSKQSLYYWNVEGKRANNLDVVATSSIPKRPSIKLSGWNYIGQHEEHYDVPVYYKVWWNSPLWWLNSNFDPKKAYNCFAIKYTELNGGREKDGYFLQSIMIDDWTPAYPIRRSGWLASRLLPDDRLVIWDFIGWRACG